MARDLPDPIEKRDLVYGDDTSDSRRIETGDQFFEENFIVDALNAYEEADHREGGENVLEKAVSGGNYFLVRRVRNNWPDLVDENVLRESAENAEETGRYTDAVKFYRDLGETDAMERVQEELEEKAGISLPEVVRKDIADAKEKDEV